MLFRQRGISGRTLRPDAPGGSLQLADHFGISFSEVVKADVLIPVQVRRAAGDGPVSVEFFTAPPPPGHMP